MNDNEKWILLQLRKVIIEMDNIIKEAAEIKEWDISHEFTLRALDSLEPCFKIASNRLNDAVTQFKEL